MTDITTENRPLLRTSRAEDIGTALFATWLILGLFVDGWAHNNRPELESFWTPWHGLFYSGFLATAAWIGGLVYRRLPAAGSIAGAVPSGYRAAVAGLAVFAVGGAGDAVWHTIFGVETSIDALLSPTHLLLFVGMVLIVSSPFRAGWSDGGGREIAWPRFAPIAISAALTTLIVAFFFMYAFAPVSGLPSARYSPETGDGGLFVVAGVLEIMWTNLLLMSPVLLIVRRWRPPVGTFTVMLGAIGILFEAMIDVFEQPWEVAAPLVAGVAADIIVGRMDPLRARRRDWYALASLVPTVMWSAHFATFAVFRGIGWPVEAWSGAIVFAALGGAALAYLMVPPKHAAVP